MEIQQFIRVNFRGKSVVLVGGATFHRNYSSMIDAHDIVIRFNLFKDKGFLAGLCGTKINYWCTNVVRSEPERVGRDLHCDVVRERNPPIAVLTPCDGSRRLKAWRQYFSEKGLPLVFPTKPLKCGLIDGLKPWEPTVGFYMACRLINEDIRVSVIGFTGGVTPKYHNGKREVELLSSNPMVTFHTME